MGRKGSWISALRKAFTPSSKDKLVDGSEKRNVKEKKKWGFGKLRHGETNTFIPLYKEPSSIEKILGDAEREHHKAHPLPKILRDADREYQKTHSSPKLQGDVERESQKTNLASKISGNEARENHKAQPLPSKKTHHPKIHVRNQPNIQNFRISAIKIQAAYRGYMARKRCRALRGFVRLQGVMRGQSVKHQTMNAMRCMQMLVKVQAQIRSRRIQMMESQSIQHQASKISEKENDSTFSKWSLTHQSESGTQEEWEDSVLTKEEVDARTERKVDAIMKRERALAYAYSRQVTPTSAHSALTEIRKGGFPLWWNWLERQLPINPQEKQTIQSAKKDVVITPRHYVEADVQTRPNSRSRQTRFGHENLELSTPRSVKSVVAMKAKVQPNLLSNGRQAQSKNVTEMSIKDDESLTSCPAFTVPNYMAPTVSAKAKVRAYNDSKYSSPMIGTNPQTKKRFSFGLTQSIGSFRWSKSSLMESRDSSSQRVRGKHRPMHSIGNLSVDSTVSLPVGVGRKSFK